MYKTNKNNFYFKGGLDNMTKMKKAVLYLFLLFCLCIVPASLVSAGDVIENNNSGIPDKKLYRAILKELGKKPNKKFTKQETKVFECKL